MPSLEGAKISKKGKMIKNLTSSKLLNKLPVSSPQTKGGNNSCKLKENDKYCILCISIMKSQKKVFNNLIKLL